MLDRKTADIICDLIDCATETNWPDARDGMIARGYEGKEVAAAVDVLCEIAGRSPIIEAGDF